MELELKRDAIHCFETVADVTICQEETQEAIVPDACPDILRIVEVCGQACLTGKQAREGMATVSGMVRASVLYLPETGGCLRHMELSVPFTCQVEAPGLTSQGTILADPRLRWAEARVLNPRKILLRVDLALLLAAAMALTACGSTAAVSSEAAASATAAPEVTASPEEAAVEPAAETAVTYPLTVTDQLGREVTIETEPKTLASGYYISTSLLIALGLQDELVGVEAKADKRTIYSLSAPELQSLPSIGTAKEFDLEGCAALTPDLVIVPAKLKDSIPQMEELGLTVLAVKPEDQDKLYGAIDLLAQATNTVARGEELKSAIEDNLLSLHEAIGDAEAPTVYMAGNSSVLQTAGPAMYQNYMIENAGGLNAAASVEDTYWAEVSYEQVLDWDPDYIILASDADYDVDSVLNDAALADCTAVREGHVYQLPHAIESVDSPVPGSFLGSVYLGSVLHPEQVSEQFYHDCADTFYTTYYGFTPASYE